MRGIWRRSPRVWPSISRETDLRLALDGSSRPSVVCARIGLEVGEPVIPVVDASQDVVRPRVSQRCGRHVVQEQSS